jgi:hypothetical protein
LPSVTVRCGPRMRVAGWFASAPTATRRSSRRNPAAPSPRLPTTSSASPRERCQTVSPSPATAISLSPISAPIASRS